jgi:tetratricopeptide (TPR) repeat protein
MLRQFNRFLFLAIIVATALYITLTNSDTATLRLGPKLTITSYAGVIYIGIFVAGCIAASLVALFFGLKSYLRERRLISHERHRQNFMKNQEKARGLMAAGDWGAARVIWEDVISRDPENIVARVEISRCIENLGDKRESLRVLDATRASSKASVEVLFRAARLNQELGNNTAAKDNLALILAQGPSHRALELARDTSEALGLYEEALKYQDDLEGIGYGSENRSAVRARLAFAQIKRNSQGEEARRAALLTLIKRHPDFPPALESLAEIERSRGSIDLCAEYLVKAARASGGENAKWRRVVDLWLQHPKLDQRQRAERAIAAARSATKNASGRARLEGELLLIETLLAVNHFQEAERVLDSFAALAQREVSDGSVDAADLSRRLTIQRGYCQAQLGNLSQTTQLWRELAVPASAGSISARDQASSASLRSEPSPVLSTP